jgi:hypothetical protein
MRMAADSSMKCNEYMEARRFSVVITPYE